MAGFAKFTLLPLVQLYVELRRTFCFFLFRIHGGCRTIGSEFKSRLRPYREEWSKRDRHVHGLECVRGLSMLLVSLD